MSLYSEYICQYSKHIREISEFYRSFLDIIIKRNDLNDISNVLWPPIEHWKDCKDLLHSLAGKIYQISSRNSVSRQGFRIFSCRRQPSAVSLMACTYLTMSKQLKIIARLSLKREGYSKEVAVYRSLSQTKEHLVYTYTHCSKVFDVALDQTDFSVGLQGMFIVYI